MAKEPVVDEKEKKEEKEEVEEVEKKEEEVKKDTVEEADKQEPEHLKKDDVEEPKPEPEKQPEEPEPVPAQIESKLMPTFRDALHPSLTSDDKKTLDLPLKVSYKDLQPINDQDDDNYFMWPPESMEDVLSDEEQLIWLAEQTPDVIE